MKNFKNYKYLLIAVAVIFSAFAVDANAKAKKIPKERKLYVGSDSTEAILTFSHYVELNTSRAPNEEKAKEQIENQVTHLFGPLAVAKFSAVPKGEHQISNIKIEAVTKKLFKANYTYTGTFVVKNGIEATYPLVLPNNPSTIYKESMSGSHNPCTDDHYQSEGDFWYFWNPENPGCKLKEGEDFKIINAKMQRKENTKISYPEYSRLADAKGNVLISMLMGMDDPDENAIDPNKSRDENAFNFREIKKSLLKNGYKSRIWNRSEIEELVKEDTNSEDPYVEEFTKTISSGAKKYQLTVRIFFGPSGIDQESTAFHYFFKDSIENASVMIYDGHSGLGGHLDLASIEENRGFKLTPPKNKYQIYFFNSCSSYTYYNTMYFGRKKSTSDKNGTKNLDILTNGLSTYFYVMHDTNMALVKAVEASLSGKANLSYQAIAKQIDSGNLFGVNGDEDNPSTNNR